MSWYVPTPVAPDLSRDVVTGWTARAGGRHQLIPDGCVDVLWIAPGTLVVCGPETTAWEFTLPPRVEAAGVRFRAGRAGSVLGFHTAETRDLRVRLEDVRGAAAARRLAEQVDAAEQPAARLEVLERAVRGWLADAAAPDPAVAIVRRMLVRDIATPVGMMAEEAGLSERQLHRRCSEAFGYGAATLRRILRLQRFLGLARHPGAPRSVAALAAAAGYTDQPHLSRDCRVIAGTSPAALVSDPYTTPESQATTLFA